MKNHRHLITTVGLLAVSLLWTACATTRHQADPVKVEGMVWFNPTSREVLQFRKAYVLQTKWDSTASGLHKSEHSYAYSLDKTTSILSFNNTAYQVQAGGPMGWTLKKDSLRGQPAIVFNPIPNLLQAEEVLTGIHKQIHITGTIALLGTPQPQPASVIFERIGDGPGDNRIEARGDAQGNYSITIPGGYKYRARVEGPNALGEARIVSFYNDQFLDSAHIASWHEKPLRLVRLQQGVTIRLLSVFFEFDRAELLTSALTELESIAQWMNANTQAVIEIAGHTDNIGAKGYNQRLSEKRALSVKNFLITKGIDPSRINTIGYGETRPLTSNDDEQAGRHLNRRIELRILGE